MYYEKQFSLHLNEHTKMWPRCVMGRAAWVCGGLVCVVAGWPRHEGPTPSRLGLSVEIIMRMFSIQYISTQC